MNLIGPVTFDYETIELLPDDTHTASTEFYRHNFRVSSCAFTWKEEGRVVSKYVVGEDEVGIYIKQLAEHKTPVIVFNYQFEYGVTKCRFGVDLNWHADAMRLVQVYDNGGAEDAFEIVFDEDLKDIDEDDENLEPIEGKRVFTAGLSLVKSSMRILDKPDHKLEAYKWLRANGVKKGTEGANLNLLPPDIMERYNIQDTETTLELYDFCIEYFKSINYDWTVDHYLYMSTARFVTEAKIRGVLVDREPLKVCIATVTKEMADITEAFHSKLANEIKLVERQKLLEEIRGRKTLRGRKNYLKKIRISTDKYNEDIKFNVGSNKQLKMLFMDVLEIQPVFFTKKEQPSFKSSMLGQWGENGLMLGERRKRLIILKQAESLLGLSEYDGRFHLNLKVSSTKSGRLSGGN